MTETAKKHVEECWAILLSRRAQTWNPVQWYLETTADYNNVPLYPGVLKFNTEANAQDYACQTHGRQVLTGTVRVVRVEIREL